MATTIATITITITITITGTTTATITGTPAAGSARPRGSQVKFQYLRDAAKIYEKSFAMVRAETDLGRFSPAEADVVVRLVHAAGEPAVARFLAHAGDWVAVAR